MFIIVTFSSEFFFNLFEQYGFSTTSYTCEYLDEIRIIKRPYFFKVSFSLYINIRCFLSREICKYCATNLKFSMICGTYLLFLYSEILIPIRSVLFFISCLSRTWIVFSFKNRTVPFPVKDLMDNDECSHAHSDPFMQYFACNLISHQA